LPLPWPPAGDCLRRSIFSYPSEPSSSSHNRSMRRVAVQSRRRATGESVDKFPDAIPPSCSFRSRFTISCLAFVHGFAASVIIRCSLSCGNACRDGGNAGRGRRIRRSG
jgi:hypothetical protein